MLKYLLACTCAIICQSIGWAQSLATSATYHGWRMPATIPVTYQYVELTNLTASPLDIVYEATSETPLPSAWTVEVETPSSNGYTTDLTGLFKVGDNSRAWLFFLAFKPNGQVDSCTMRVKLYLQNNPNDSLLLRFRLATRPDATTSIQYIATAASWGFYDIHNQLFTLQTSDVYCVQFWDINGRSHSLPHTQQAWDTSQLPSGFYIATATDRTGQQRFKYTFIKP